MTIALHEHHPEDFQSLDELYALHDRKLRLLGERLNASPEWRDHLGRSGVSALDLRDRASLTAMPTLEKADLRARYPFPLLTVPVEQVARFSATSGTTGLPVMFGFTRHDWQVTLVRQLARIWRAIGVRPGDRVYQGFGYGLWLGGPSMDVALADYGAVNFPIGPGRAELAVQWLADHGHTVATMSPLWATTLLGAARKAGIDPRTDWRLRVGLFGGQAVSATLRAQIEAQMPAGFMAHNNYGTTEAGGPILTVSCPHSHANDQMHLINEDSVLTEIVDPKTLAPVAPGEVGEVVITTLDKQASPVVRWRTHDLVRLAERPYGCACGRRAFPLIGRLIGRSDDMLKVRGVIVFPTQVEDVIAAIDGLAKEAWQIYIDGDALALEQIDVAVERLRSAATGTEALAAEAAQRLASRLGLTVNVTCHPDGTLPRYEAKATRVIRRG